MKIKSIITFFVLMSIPTYSFAAGVCLIKDKSAPVLFEYIKNNRQVIKNVTNAIVKENKNTSNEKIKETKEAKSLLDKESLKIKNEFNKNVEKLNNATNEISGTFNEIFNFTGYHSYFSYYVTFPISNEVPSQVKRDYSILEKENKGLVEYIKKLNTKGETNILVKDACKGVTKGIEKCKTTLNNKESKDILGKLIQNNDIILDLYRNSVMGEEKVFNYDNLTLVDNNFITDIQKYYGKEAVGACNEDKGGFFEQISTAISNINLINKKGKDGIKKWKDAFALLLGSKPNEENKIEQKKLKEYLSQNGVSSEKEEIIMKNLAKYNTSGSSLNNNFLSNAFSSTMKKIEKDIKLWKKENVGPIISKDSKKTNIVSVQKKSTNEEISTDIKNSISKLYQDEIPFAAIGDINTEKLRAKIISSHFNVQDSIKTLNETCVISVKMCNQQGGGGDCGSCN